MPMRGPASGKDTAARDQIALVNLRLLLNTAVATGLLAQGQQWELLSDEWGATSSGETYAGGALPYYSNSAAAVDAIPDMTSNVAPSGVASASSAHASWPAWKAFNDAGADDIWESTGACPQWLEYQFAAVKTIARYSVLARSASPNGTPSAWAFEGYNGATWDVLDTRSGEVFGLAERKYFDIAAPASYLRYRLNVSAVVGAALVDVAELEMFQPTLTNAVLMPAAAVAAASAPPVIAVYFLWRDDSGVADLAADCVVEASRDNGATWTAATLTALTAEAGFDGTYAAVKASANVGGQPAGTQMLCRFTLANAAQRIAAPALYAG